MKKLFIIIILASISLIIASGEDEGNFAAQDQYVKLSEYEKIMNRYFRGDPRSTAVDDINRLVNEYNSWIERRKSVLDAESEKINREFKSITGLKKQIDALDERLTRVPDPNDEKAVEAYNAEMNKRNVLVEKYNGLARKYKELETAFNNTIEQFNLEKEARKSKLDAQKAEIMEEIKAIDQWFEEKRDRAFFEELNRKFCELIQEKRRTGNLELDGCINRLRDFRHELGTYAITKQNKVENGLIVIPVTLGSNVECFYIVDTGASLVTVSPELVKVLGLSDHVGEEIETSLAGGIMVKGKEIVIPLLSVLDKTAQNVPAIVLPSTGVGVDGLLGRSFLKRFIIHIDDAREPKLMLESKINR